MVTPNVMLVMMLKYIRGRGGGKIRECLFWAIAAKCIAEEIIIRTSPVDGGLNSHFGISG